MDVTKFDPTPENEAAEEAAFFSGFDGTDVEPAANPQEETGTPNNEEPAAEGAAEGEAPVEKAATSYLSVDDFNSALTSLKTENQRTIDRAFGKIGELQQRIDAIKSVAAISPKAKERLAAEFPELGRMLFEGVEDIQPSQERRDPVAAGPAPAIDPNAIKEQAKQEIALELLDEKHEDWREVVQAEDFLTWKATVLDPQTANELDNSWKAGFVAKQLTAFKEWRAQQQKQQQQVDNKRQRLEAAITPKGIPRSPAAGNYDDDEEGAMLAAFKTR